MKSEEPRGATSPTPAPPRASTKRAPAPAPATAGSAPIGDGEAAPSADPRCVNAAVVKRRPAPFRPPGDGGRPAVDPPQAKRFSIVLGVLCDARGIVLRLASESTLVVEFGGREWNIGVSVKQGKRTDYLVSPAAQLWACPPLAPYLRLLTPTKSTNIDHHRLVGLVGLGVNFNAGENVGMHHIDLNGGNNVAGNLLPLAQRTHDAVHREGIDPDPDAYLARLKEDPTGMTGMPEGLARRINEDRGRLAGHPPPNVAAAVMAAESVAAKSGHVGSDYNPVVKAIKDLSLSFEGEEMVVSATYSESKPKLDQDGAQATDIWGRKMSEQLWRPVTATTGGRVYDASEELPPHLKPHKNFTLNGSVAERPRHSMAALHGFAVGRSARSDLAAQVARAIGGRVLFADKLALSVCVAYAAFTYVFPIARRCPFLLITSSSPASGKSTTLETMSLLAFNAHLIHRGSLAVTVRLASQARSTILLDEMDVLADPRSGAEAIQFLCCRSDRAATYRNMGPSGEVREYNVFGPTLLANIAGAVPVVASRCIEVMLAPAAAGSPVLAEAFDGEDWLALRDELLLWAGANWQAVRRTHDTDPEMNVGANRHADLWRPLLAVGLHLGGQAMYEALKEAALAASKARSVDDIEDTMALAIAAVIADEARASGTGRGFHRSLKSLLALAQASLEPDRCQELSSKRLAAFARGLGVNVEKMGVYGNSYGATFKQPKVVLGKLQARFSHLAQLLATPSAEGPGGP